MTGPTPSDAQLLAPPCTSADFGAVYDRHARHLYQWFLREGAPASDAPDLLAELFAQAWRSRQRFRDPGDGSARPWLYGIAKNLPAPAEVQRDLAGLGRSFPGAGDIQLDQGIEVARSDHHVLYAAPTSGGGFCVTVDADHGTGGCSTPIAANAPLAYVAEGGPGRTGQDDPGLGGGYGGGSIFGRVQDPAAVTVDIGLAAAVTAVTARVGTNGFFIVDLPESAWKAMFPESGNTHPLGPATAYDAKGQAVATSP